MSHGVIGERGKPEIARLSALGAFLPLRDRTDLRHIEELKERWQIRSTRDAAIGTVGDLG